MQFRFYFILFLLGISQLSFSKDIAGRWQALDEKTGETTVQIEIRAEDNRYYSGTIIKITPRVKYLQPMTCVDCPSPYKDQPIIGMKSLIGLERDGELNYKNGQIIDPLTGKVYKVKVRVSTNGKRLTLSGYTNNSVLGRSQTWVRIK